MTRLLLLLLAVAPSVVVAADAPPNVIFFLSDDQRADFLGCAGHPILKTPVIDRLAKDGVRFENAFVTTSICAASRATLFTGLYERTHRYTFGKPPVSKEHAAESYPVLLKKAGYRTGFVGKFGVSINAKPNGEMFDFFRPQGRGMKRMPDGSKRHFTDVAGDTAIEFVESCKPNQPFCLSVSFNAAHASDGDKVNHYPWPQSEDGLYEDAEIPPPLVSTDHWKTLPKFFHDSMHRDRYFWRWDTPEKYQRNVKAYYRMITGLDRNMGRVLEAVEKAGFGDNTIVLFMGDNGYYKGSRGFAGKWSHWDESLRVPLVMHDPRLPKDRRGKVLPQMALNVDVAATIVDAAGLNVPSGYQGHSLLPLMRGHDVDWRTDFFCEHLMDNPKIPKYEGVRGTRYVYARYLENLPEGEFLHDLETDPLELENLVGDSKYADVLATMRKRCDVLRDGLGGEWSREKFPTAAELRKRQAAEKQRKP